MTEIEFRELSMNPFSMIGEDWMLITAGTKETGYNTMTASWGHLGSIWGHGGGKATAVIYVRPQRYTKEFIDREPLFTLTFFDKQYRNALGYLGSHSGRDGDKIAHVGLTPVFDDGITYFEEAKLTLVCRKLYQAPLLEENFLSREVVQEQYPRRDFHDMYIAQIERVLVEE